MEISRRESNDVIILEPHGAMDMFTCTDLHRRIDGLIRKKNRKIVINLNHLSYIDASGFGILISQLVSLRARGGETRLSAPTKMARRILHLTKQESAVSLFETDTDAIESFLA